MRLTCRKALLVSLNARVEIITEATMTNDGYFVVGILRNNGDMAQTRLTDLRLFPEEVDDKIDNLVDKFYGAGVKEWRPDWSKIK